MYSKSSSTLDTAGRDLASPYSVDEIDALRDACKAGDEEWQRAKGDYADWLIEIG